MPGRDIPFRVNRGPIPGVSRACAIGVTELNGSYVRTGLGNGESVLSRMRSEGGLVEVVDRSRGGQLLEQGARPLLREALSGPSGRRLQDSWRRLSESVPHTSGQQSGRTRPRRDEQSGTPAMRERLLGHWSRKETVTRATVSWRR